jgi:hypothetical protein
MDKTNPKVEDVEAPKTEKTETPAEKPAETPAEKPAEAPVAAKSTNMTPLVVVFAILAIVGVGFGIYGMTQSGNNSGGTTTTSETSTGTKTNTTTTTTTTTTNNGSSSDTYPENEYIELTAWKIKIHAGKAFYTEVSRSGDGYDIVAYYKKDASVANKKRVTKIHLVRSTEQPNGMVDFAKVGDYYYYDDNYQSSVGTFDDITTEQVESIIAATKEMGLRIVDSKNYVEIE